MFTRQPPRAVLFFLSRARTWVRIGSRVFGWDRLELTEKAIVGASALPLHPVFQQSLRVPLLRMNDSVPLLNHQLVRAGPAEPAVARRVSGDPMRLTLFIGE